MVCSARHEFKLLFTFHLAHFNARKLTKNCDNKINIPCDAFDTNMAYVKPQKYPHSKTHHSRSHLPVVVAVAVICVRVRFCRRLEIKKFYAYTEQIKCDYINVSGVPF